MSKRRVFVISGMHCAGCAAAVERAVKKFPEVSDVYVNFASGRLNFVSEKDHPADEEIISAIKKAGFKAELPPVELTPEKEVSMSGQWWAFGVALLFSAALLIVCMGNIPANWRINSLLQLLLLIPVMAAGSGFFRRGIPALFRGVPNMDSLISCGAAAGIIYSLYLMFTASAGHLYFDAAAMIVTLIMLGKNLEQHSRRNASAARS